MYSNGLPQSGTNDNTSFTQVIEWTKYVLVFSLSVLRDS